MSYIYLLIAVIAEVAATSALKASAGFTKLYPSLVVVVGYGLAFYFLSLVLKTVPVGIAYAIWAGLGVVCITLIGLWVFNQTIDMAGIIGITLIIAGVVVIKLFSESTSL